MGKLKLGSRFDPLSKKMHHCEQKEREDIEAGVSRKQRTVEEIRKIMNAINSDLEFTTEVEEDFSNGRLPTLSFEVWSTQNGLQHSSYEKPMGCQTLTMQRSSQGDQNKYSILVNELASGFEVMSKEITLEERIAKIDHFTQQLVNSGYGYKQSKEIVISMLKGLRRN